MIIMAREIEREEGKRERSRGREGGGRGRRNVGLHSIYVPCTIAESIKLN